MPGKVRVKILAGRNLPVMDRSGDTTDAYVEIKFGSITCKTDVYRKSLHPQWNSDWFRFEVDDADLQDEPLQIRIMDHDTYSANDAIGKVNISLNPLLLPSLDGSTQNTQSGKGSVMSGWLPVYDTMHGIRGEINIIVKVDLFSDANKFRQSSCGIQFFHSPIIPYGYHVQVIHGFVEELVVNDDPEYQWIDKIRTPRASNEARQVVFLKLSAQVQRKIGLKATDLGANAVIGYKQNFDLEGDVGVVARGIGTAVTLIKIQEQTLQPHPEKSAFIEEQTLKYLEFLTLSDARKSSDSKFDYDPFNADATGCDIVYKILGIEPNETMSRTPSVIINKKIRNQPDQNWDIIKEEVANTDEQDELEEFKHLFQQEELRGEEEPASTMRNKIRKIKSQSKLAINKRINSLKAMDSISISSDISEQTLPASSSEISLLKPFSLPLRQSAVDLGANIIRKVKRSKCAKSSNEGVGMATLLVRSMMAGPSLESIAEHADTMQLRHSPNPLRRFEYGDSGSLVGSPTKKHHHSHENKLNITLGDSLVDLNASNVSSTNVSMTSLTFSESSSEVDEYSDEEENEVVMIDADTISMVVKSVLASEEAETGENEWIQPSNDEQGDSDEEGLLPAHDIRRSSRRHSSIDMPIRTGATHIMNPKDKKHMETLIVEHDDSEQALQTFLATDSSKVDEQIWIQPGSTAEEDYTEVEPTSLYQDFKESITETLHHLHLPHMPHHAKPEIKEHGLLETAMETMLMERSTLLGAQYVEAKENTETKNFEDKRNASVESLKKLLAAPFRRRSHEPHEDSSNQPKTEKFGLFDSAMKTMLIETAHIIEGVGIHQNDLDGDDGPSKHRREEGGEQTSPTAKHLLEIENAMKSFDIEREGQAFGRSEDVPNQKTAQKSDATAKIPNTSQKGENVCKTAETPLQSPEIHSTQRRKSSIDSLKKFMISPFRRRSNDSVDSIKQQKKERFGLFDSAMKTMLVETAHIIEGVGVHPQSRDAVSASSAADSEIASSKTLARDLPLSSEPETSSQTSKTSQPLQSEKCLNESEPNSIDTAPNSVASDGAFCNPTPPITSYTLTVTEPTTPTSGNDRFSEMPLFALPEDHSIPKKDHHTHGVSKHLSPIQQAALASAKRSPKPKRKTNLIVNPSHQNNENHHYNKTLIPCKSASLINLTNKTNRFAHDVPHSTHRSHDEKSDGHQHHHAHSESIEVNSPSKVHNSSSSYNTSASKQMPTIKDKDGKDNKDTICRRSSDSDLSITPKGSSLNADIKTAGVFRVIGTPMKTPLNLENLDMLEYPFLTLDKYPVGFILQLGSTVCSRSVKLLERVPNPEEPETRDFWWKELRMEVRSHARAIGCNVVLNYTEVTTISDDVCVLSATGTAAYIDSQFTMTETNRAHDMLLVTPREHETIKNSTKHESAKSDEPKLPTGCSICHIPHNRVMLPGVHGRMHKCAVCRKAKVPEILLTTIEIPDNLQIVGRGCLIHAQACRYKKDLKSEMNAREISDALPFLEYDLQRLLVNKLKAKGMNAMFGMRLTVSIGEKMMALIGTGTGVYLPALPPPVIPKIVQGNSWTNSEKINELNRSLEEAVNRNREIYQLKVYGDVDSIGNPIKSDVSDESDDEVPENDVSSRSKNICILEIDDVEDLEIISLILEPGAPEGFHVVNTQSLPGLHDVEIARNLQMFTQVWRAKFPTNQKVASFPKHFLRLLQTIYFKLRSMMPCAICDLKFRLDLPEGDEFQILVNGIALGLMEPQKMKMKRRINSGVRSMADDDLIFNLDEEHTSELTQSHSSPMQAVSSHSIRESGSLKFKNKSALASSSRPKYSSLRLEKHMHTNDAPVQERFGVDITTLTYIPNGKIDKYLGNLKFFFIRESTSIRENGGISGFVHSFITELLAVVRAHITAIGGNAMVSFYMSELTLLDNPHKNQGQTLISVGGDVVFVSYTKSYDHT